MSKGSEDMLIALGLFGLYWWFIHPATTTSVVIPAQTTPPATSGSSGVPNTVPTNLIPASGSSTQPTTWTIDDGDPNANNNGNNTENCEENPEDCLI
jgi:hypothetical protein